MDTPLIQHQESRDGPIKTPSSRGNLNSRGGSGRRVDLTNADDGPILEQRSCHIFFCTNYLTL
jgi:hypothetical protein